VLAGILGTLLAAGLDPADAAALAADVHGRAATRASQGAGDGDAGKGGGGHDAGKGGGSRRPGHHGRGEEQGERGPGGPILASDGAGGVPAVVRALLGGGWETGSR
jgi:hypothetical protein